MGTNYYWVENQCPTCKHAPDRWHIGKSSGGWVFLWHALESEESPIGAPVYSVAAWRQVFKRPGGIEDEYGAPVSVSQLMQLAEKKRGSTRRMKEYAWKDRIHVWEDPEGWEFTDGRFS